MNPLPVSLTVVTLNEEKNLARCLQSAAGLAEEIIVLDSGSTDGTREVAERFGAKWVHQDWLGFRDQKNLALTHCTKEWVLSLDADEEISPALKEEIIRFFQGAHESHQGASFPRKVWFLGRWITHGDWYPDRKLRLVKREGAAYTGHRGHDKLELSAGSPILEMKSDLLHYSFPTTGRYIEKIKGFSDAYLELQLESGKKFSLFPALFRPWWRFFRSYVLRLGFLDGYPGYWIAVATSFAAFVRHSRLYELEHNSEPTPPPPSSS